MVSISFKEMDVTIAERFINVITDLLNLEALIEGGNDKEKIAAESVMSIFCHTLNPIKMGVLVIDALAILQKRFNVLNYLTAPLKADIIKILVGFMNNLGSIHQIRDLVTEKVTSGQDVLYLIGKHNIIEMLENPKMKSIIYVYWEGPFNKMSIWKALGSVFELKKFDKRICGQ